MKEPLHSVLKSSHLHYFLQKLFLVCVVELLYKYGHIKLDLAFTFTFVSQSGHFFVKKLNWIASALEYKDLTWLIVFIITHIICEQDLGTQGKKIHILKKLYIIVFYAKLNIHRSIVWFGTIKYVISHWNNMGLNEDIMWFFSKNGDKNL